MNPPSEFAVTPAQVRERIRDYREAGFEAKAMPHIIFLPQHHVCPWADCGFPIAGIDFQLELFGDDQAYQQWMHAWWKGPGLVGRCPGCGNYVLFTMHEKRPVKDLTGYEGAILPDDWYSHAYVLS